MNKDSIIRAQVEEFCHWFKSFETPAEFDRDTLEQYSLDNASDVKPEEIFETARSTVLMYLDDRSCCPPEMFKN